MTISVPNRGVGGGLQICPNFPEQRDLRFSSAKPRQLQLNQSMPVLDDKQVWAVSYGPPPPSGGLDRKFTQFHLYATTPTGLN